LNCDHARDHETANFYYPAPKAPREWCFTASFPPNKTFHWSPLEAVTPLKILSAGQMV
jgi:hypothetical protein